MRLHCQNWAVCLKQDALCGAAQEELAYRASLPKGDNNQARSVLLGADFYESDDEAPARGNRPRLGIGRDVVLDRVIVDKNARIGDGVRLVNSAGVDHADAANYYIRGGIIIVPKDGVIEEGTVV